MGFWIIFYAKANIAFKFWAKLSLVFLLDENNE